MRRGPTATSRPTQLPKPQPLLVGSPEAGQSLPALLMLTFYSHPSFGDVMQLGTFPRNPYMSQVLAHGLPQTHMCVSPIAFSPPPPHTHTRCRRDAETNAPVTSLRHLPEVARDVSASQASVLPKSR